MASESQPEVASESESNSAVLHFTGKDSHKHDQRKYEEWYTKDTMIYLANASIPSTAIAYIFQNNEVEKQHLSFANQFRHLVVFKKQHQTITAACFIAFSPAQFATSHYIFGLLTEEVLLLVNPLGKNTADFYEYLDRLDLPHLLPNTKLYIANTVIQKDEHAIVSCGPLCAELLLHFSHIPPEILHQRLVTSSQPAVAHHSNFMQVDMTQMLPIHLQELTQLEKGDPKFQSLIEGLRFKHFNILSKLNGEECSRCEKAGAQVYITQTIFKEHEEALAKQAIKSTREQINKALEYILYMLNETLPDIRQKNAHHIELRAKMLAKAFLYLQDWSSAEFGFADGNKLRFSPISNIQINLNPEDNAIVAELIKQAYECFLHIFEYGDATTTAEVIESSVKKIRARFIWPEAASFKPQDWAAGQINTFEPILPRSIKQLGTSRIMPSHTANTGAASASATNTSFSGSSFTEKAKNISASSVFSSLIRENEILIPADGDCLYTTVFLGYLLPVINMPSVFTARLLQLVENISADDAEILRKHLGNSYGNVNELRNLKNYILEFKQHAGLSNSGWGGPAEIETLENKLNIVIQELIPNPDITSRTNKPYVPIDEKSHIPANDNREIIYILRTDPTSAEAIDHNNDLVMQIGQAISASGSVSLQHYRLVLAKRISVSREYPGFWQRPVPGTVEPAKPVAPLHRPLTPDPIKTTPQRRGGIREINTNTVGVEINLGLTPRDGKLLGIENLKKLIASIRKCFDKTKNEASELNPDIFKHVIDKAAEISDIAGDKNFEHVRNLLESGLIEKSQEFTKNTGILINIFKDKSGASSLTLEAVIDHLKHNLIDYVQKAKDQDIYTALQGFYDTYVPDPERFKLLEEMVLPFLQNSEKETLLVLGEAGSGKTKFAEYLTKYLWEFFTGFNKAHIPIYIRLVDPNIKDTKENLIEDALKGLGLNDEEVELLLDSTQRPFCFIFDGVDELIRKNKEYETFYITNKIHQRFPGSHCIFTGRLSGFSSDTYEQSFEPIDEYGETRLTKVRARTICLAPFDEKTKKIYIEKFIEHRPEAKIHGYTNVSEVYDQIQSISHLNDIVGRPILLMMTMTVLPYLKGFYVKEKKQYAPEIIHKDLLHMYTHYLYERSAVKISQRNNELLYIGGEDSNKRKLSLYDCIMRFSKEFAKQLNNAPEGESKEISEERIFPDDEDDSDLSSPAVKKWMVGFKKLFCKVFDHEARTTLFRSQDEFKLYYFGREGCELLDHRGIPGNFTYKFTHEDFLDYFATLLPQAENIRRRAIREFMNYCDKEEEKRMTSSEPQRSFRNS